MLAEKLLWNCTVAHAIPCHELQEGVCMGLDVRDMYQINSNHPPQRLDRMVTFYILYLWEVNFNIFRSGERITKAQTRLFDAQTGLCLC